MRNDTRVPNMPLLKRILIATEKLANNEPIDTPDVEALAEGYNLVGDLEGSGAAFPRKIYAERMAMNEKYGMEEELI